MRKTDISDRRMDNKTRARSSTRQIRHPVEKERTSWKRNKALLR